MSLFQAFSKRISFSVSALALGLGLVGQPGFADVPLVDILCDYLSANKAGTLVEDIEWKEFAQHLSERKSYERSQGALTEASSFKKCVEKYASEMELGEFILQGRDAIETSFETIQKKTSAAPALLTLSLLESNPSDLRQLSTPEISLSLTLDEPVDKNTVAEDRLHARLERYNSLWESFLAVLRNRLMSES